MGTCQSSGSQAWVVILVGPFNLQSKLKTIPAKKNQPTENPMFKARAVEAARYTKYPSPTGTAFPCKFHGPKKSIPQKCSVGNTGRLGPSVTRASPMSEKRGGRCEGGSARHAGPSVVTATGGIQTQKEGVVLLADRQVGSWADLFWAVQSQSARLRFEPPRLLPWTCPVDGMKRPM